MSDIMPKLSKSSFLIDYTSFIVHIHVRKCKRKNMDYVLEITYFQSCELWLASLSSAILYSEILQPTTTSSAGVTDHFPIQGIQYLGTSCLEFSVFSYEKFRYHRHFQGTSENWTVLCCIRHGLTFLLPPAPPIRTLDYMRAAYVFDIDIDIDIHLNRRT